MSSEVQRKPPRRAVTKSDRAVIVYFPDDQVEAMNEAARRNDTDRSKWIRRAIREALQRSGFSD